MHSSNAITHTEIQAELVGALFRSVPVAIVVHIISSTVLVFLLWRWAPHHNLLIWLALLYGLTVIRWLLMRAYQQRRQTSAMQVNWGKAAATVSWSFGLIWGAVPVFSLIRDNLQPS